MFFSIFKSINFLYCSNKKLYKSLKNILGFSPDNFKFYELAFIHRSASITNPDGSVINNERLEYLGDAVLSAIIADFLFTNYPDKNEGFLTKMRSKIVSRENLNELAKKVGLNNFIISHTDKSPDNKPRYIGGNVFEALIGAIYIDKGYKVTKHFLIKRIIKNYVSLIQLESTDKDFKSNLIEWGQKYKKKIFFDTREDNEKSNKLSFFVSYIKIENNIFGTGTGKTKKEAEQNAAEQALLKVIE